MERRSSPGQRALAAEEPSKDLRWQETPLGLQRCEVEGEQAQHKDWLADLKQRGNKLGIAGEADRLEYLDNLLEHLQKYHSQLDGLRETANNLEADILLQLETLNPLLELVESRT